MKRNTPKKKLNLDREAVRLLSLESLKPAAGGQTRATCSAICSDVICPPTGVDHGCGPA